MYDQPVGQTDNLHTDETVATGMYDQPVGQIDNIQTDKTVAIGMYDQPVGQTDNLHTDKQWQQERITSQLDRLTTFRLMK